MRINKLFSNFGICSRKETNKIIREGRVIVNGKPCIEGQWVELSDEILLDGKPLVPKEKIYIALNKPVGVVCTAAEEVKDNIIDYLGIDDYVFPIGRLDKDSQGLIFMTNDGDIVNKILRAGNNHEKEYIVTVNKSITDEFIKGMSNGVPILGTVTKKCLVKKESKNSFRIILTQGLNRQIRRMCEYFGYEVKKLERIRIMNVSLGNLKIGSWRYLTKKELAEINRLTENSSKTEEASI